MSGSLRLIWGRNTPVLTVDNVSVFYGRICALDRVSISVNEGEIVSIRAPTGWGKSTLYDGRGANRRPVVLCAGGASGCGLPPTGWRPGISMVPERRRLFDNLTVRENLLTGVSQEVILHETGYGDGLQAVSYPETFGPCRRSAAASSRCWPSAGNDGASDTPLV